MKTRISANSMQKDPSTSDRTKLSTALALAENLSKSRVGSKIALFQIHDMWTTSTAAGAAQLKRATQFEDKSKSRFMEVVLQEQKTKSNRGLITAFRPQGCTHFIWNVLSLICVTYDIIIQPLDLANLLPDVGGAHDIALIGLLCFWALDIILNFLTGYDVNGVTEMSFGKIAKNYMRGWFWCDFLILAIDFTVSVILGLVESDANNKGVGIVRVTRVLRSVRLLRLLRLRKLVQASEILADLSRSEFVVMLIRITRIVMSIMFLNHYIACAFYAISAAESQHAELTWISVDMPIDSSKLHLYTCSFHWAITQFTPATQNVGPHSTSERSFAVLVVLVALVTFSSLIGKMSSTMTQLLSFNASLYEQEATLRCFFRDHHLSPKLILKIWQCYRQQATHDQKIVRIQDVKYFEIMPETLRMQIRKELYIPVLKAMPIFQVAHSFCTIELPVICNHAMTETICEPMKEVFFECTLAANAYCVTRGHAVYDGSNLMSKVDLKSGIWIAEAVLWGYWYHRGTLTAVTTTMCVTLSGSRFRSVCHETQNLPGARVFRRFAQNYTDLVHELDLFDIDLDRMETSLRWRYAEAAASPERLSQMFLDEEEDTTVNQEPESEQRNSNRIEAQTVSSDATAASGHEHAHGAEPAAHGAEPAAANMDGNGKGRTVEKHSGIDEHITSKISVPDTLIRTPSHSPVWNM